MSCITRPLATGLRTKGHRFRLGNLTLHLRQGDLGMPPRNTAWGKDPDCRFSRGIGVNHVPGKRGKGERVAGLFPDFFAAIWDLSRWLLDRQGWVARDGSRSSTLSPFLSAIFRVIVDWLPPLPIEQDILDRAEQDVLHILSPLARASHIGIMERIGPLTHAGVLG